MSRGRISITVSLVARNRTLQFMGSLMFMSGQAAAADAVTDWNARPARRPSRRASRQRRRPAESRMYAMMHVAIHDAVNAIDRARDPMRTTARQLDGLDRRRRRSRRARRAGRGHRCNCRNPPACLAAGIASVEADYAAALAAIPNGAAKTTGHRGRTGRGRGNSCVAGRWTDRTRRWWTSRTRRGRARRVSIHAGLPLRVCARTGATSRRLCCNHELAVSCRVRRTSRAARSTRSDFNEIKALGGDDITTPSARTSEQTEIGLFWVESSPLAWNRIARSVSASRGSTLWENARLFGLLNLAMADGYIGSWETKYHYNFWRPVTAIHRPTPTAIQTRQAIRRGRRLQFTYPMPDHDSAHRVEGGAAAEVLKQFFGTDDDRVQRLQPDTAGRQPVRRSVPGASFVRQLLRGRG